MLKHLSLPNNKILDWSKLKAFAEDKMKLGKGENAGYQHFLIFPQYFFKRLHFQGRLKSGLCGKELNSAEMKEFIVNFFFSHIVDSSLVLKYMHIARKRVSNYRNKQQILFPISFLYYFNSGSSNFLL